MNRQSRRPLPRRFLLSVLAWALLGAPTAWAQDSVETEGNDEIFFDSVEVNVVNVEVFVTDKKGNPVPGLNREDFELFEDGKPVEITNFLAVRDGRLTPTNAGAETEPGSSPPSAAGPAAQQLRLPPLPKDQRLHVVLFMDNINTDARNRNPALAHLRKFLREGLGHQDRVMLASYHGELKIEQDFTSLPELLHSKLEAMEKINPRGRNLTRERHFLFQQIQNVSVTDREVAVREADRIRTSIQAHAQMVKNGNREVLGTLARLANSLAGLPGRKAILYVSDGLQLRPGEALLEAWDNKFSSFAGSLNVGMAPLNTLDYDSSPFFREMVSEASSSGVVIYTIDAARNRSFSHLDPAVGGFDLGTMDSDGGGRALTTELSTRIEDGFRNSMQYLAAGSGGLALVHTKALGDNLARLANDFKSFYSLGYSPESRGDGKFHRLKVKVRGKNVRVRHRSGFRDKTTQEFMSERTMSALLLNVTENPLGVSLVRGEDQESGRGKFEVPLLVRVPIGKLALLPEQNLHRGKVSVFVAVSDGDGGSSTVAERRLPVNVPSDRVNDALSQYIGHELKLKMRKGFHRLAVGVRDDVAGVASTVRFNLRVGS